MVPLVTRRRPTDDLSCIHDDGTARRHCLQCMAGCSSFVAALDGLILRFGSTVIPTGMPGESNDSYCLARGIVHSPRCSTDITFHEDNSPHHLKNRAASLTRLHPMERVCSRLK
jgi:hypothetical protein